MIFLVVGREIDGNTNINFDKVEKEKRKMKKIKFLITAAVASLFIMSTVVIAATNGPGKNQKGGSSGSQSFYRSIDWQLDPFNLYHYLRYSFEKFANCIQRISKDYS